MAIPRPAAIDEMTRRIVEGFDPEQVILFGSYARGTARLESDADLLVVAREGRSRRKLATEIDLALTGIPLAADVIVLWTEDLKGAWAQAPGVIQEALREGVILYERPPA